LHARVDSGLILLAQTEREIQHRKRLDSQRGLRAQQIVGAVRRERGLQDDLVAEAGKVLRRVVVGDVAEVDDSHIACGRQHHVPRTEVGVAQPEITTEPDHPVRKLVEDERLDHMQLLGRQRGRERGTRRGEPLGVVRRLGRDRHRRHAVEIGGVEHPQERPDFSADGGLLVSCQRGHGLRKRSPHNARVTEVLEIGIFVTHAWCHHRSPRPFEHAQRRDLEREPRPNEVGTRKLEHDPTAIHQVDTAVPALVGVGDLVVAQRTELTTNHGFVTPPQLRRDVLAVHPPNARTGRNLQLDRHRNDRARRRTRAADEDRREVRRRRDGSRRARHRALRHHDRTRDRQLVWLTDRG
jgi:hypothetical protein